MAPMKLFGTNGIRGVVGKDIDTRFAFKLGSATGVLVKGGRAAIGRDGRTSSPMLAEALVSGVLSQGCDVDDYGLITTPALQFLVKNSGASGGIMVTASHNPPEYNGFKIIDSDGVEIARMKEEMVERLVHRDLWRIRQKPGRRATPDGALRVYFSHLKDQLGTLTGKLRGLKVVVDVGNGVGALTTPVILRELGCELLTVNDNIDGLFPGRPSEPRPEILNAFSRIVKEWKADLGVAHDGDGDRAVFADMDGAVQWGDRSFALIADEVLRERTGGKVVTPVNSSMAIGEIVKKRRGKLIQTKVGSIFVSRTMLETRAILGGEENGGVFFMPHHPVRDGTMATLLVLKAMARTGRSFSSLLSKLPRYVMAKEKFACKSEVAKTRAMTRLKAKLRTRVTSQLDGLRVDVKDRGWVLVRPSGTEPLIRMYAEGYTDEDLNHLTSEFRPMIETALK